MPIRKYKPTSPGRRHGSVLTYEEVTSTTPEKSLLRPLKKSGGRNNYGRITARFRGGGHKRKYRVIDFKRSKDGIPAKVATIEYDPNRTCFIALLHYADGEQRYILAPIGLAAGLGFIGAALLCTVVRVAARSFRGVRAAGALFNCAAFGPDTRIAMNEAGVLTGVVVSASAWVAFRRRRPRRGRHTIKGCHGAAPRPWGRLGPLRGQGRPVRHGRAADTHDPSAADLCHLAAAPSPEAAGRRSEASARRRCFPRHS